MLRQNMKQKLSSRARGACAAQIPGDQESICASLFQEKKCLSPFRVRGLQSLMPASLGSSKQSGQRNSYSITGMRCGPWRASPGSDNASREAKSLGKQSFQRAPCGLETSQRGGSLQVSLIGTPFACSYYQSRTGPGDPLQSVIRDLDQ